MPTETFFNLHEEKRQRIIDAALQEFAEHTYHRASLSEIVERARIAKGSMYQYFKNKMDLYVYLVHLAVQAKFDVIDQAVAALGDKPDLFEILKTSAEAGMEFARSNPTLVAVGVNLLREADREVINGVMSRFAETRYAMLGRWFREARGSGQLDTRISLGTAQWVVTVLLEATGALIAGGNLPLEDYCRFTTEILDILENGMRPRARQPR